MKKLLVIIIAVLSFSHFAVGQGNYVHYEDSSKMTVQRYRDTCFGLLNLTSAMIPSGRLIDYSLTGINDTSFNSNVGSKLDTLRDSGVFFALADILNASVVNSSATSILSGDSVYKLAHRYQRNNSSVPLLFMLNSYQKIRPTALSQNLFTLTSDSLRLKDVAGRAQSPYDTKTIFAFSPFQSKITQFNSIAFSLPAQLWMMAGITSVQVDFGDGSGFRTLSQGSTASVYYGSSGTYFLTAKIVVSGVTYTGKSSIIYTQPKYALNPDTSWSTSVPPVFTNYTQYVAQSGVTGGTMPLSTSGPCGEGSIYDKSDCDINPGASIEVIKGCDHVFDKPIIIVEGFDPSGTVDFSALESYFNYPYGAPNASFMSVMTAAGYDFVFVRFTKNTDYIENNAQVLEDVIQRINSTKSGTNKDIIIGISMGGLVTQWALKDMEDKGLDHQVSSYFSYDSPHQGANIPLGLQYIFNEMIHDMPYLKWSDQINQLYSGFTSIAAQQMLVTYGGGPEGVATSSVRLAFAQN